MQTHATILCIETANAVTSVAIAKDGKCLHALHILEANKAADVLHTLIETLLQETSISFNELDAVAISAGPGSYTGLRIAAAAAKGYCFSLHIPLIAIPTLEAMVFGAMHRYDLTGFDYYFPMIDARRMEVFTTVFSNTLQPEQTFTSLILDENVKNIIQPGKKYLCFGNGAFKIKPIITLPNIIIFENFMHSSEDLCLLASQQYADATFKDIAYFEPDYYKAFYTTQQTSNKV